MRSTPQSLLSAAVSLLLFGTTTVATRAFSRAFAARDAGALPLVMTPAVLRDSFSEPQVGVALVGGIACCAIAFHVRSHGLAAFASLIATAVTYCTMLFVWLPNGSSFIDLRPAVTAILAYVPQTVSLAALVTHAAIVLFPKKIASRGEEAA